ncbi:conserved hypothetical protein [Ixodes scapularis]|uniref:Uncharacterized protein n=1 Tax=Ixodes scapularis TaxID=6945 RepID=B7Q823_IXOSC|nr:conserved hypothetical protein [Ixodes scapularis]|eukprot:XP_002404659.1 conserved hypothetical protein [Ixodes scapularis]
MCGKNMLVAQNEMIVAVVKRIAGTLAAFQEKPLAEVHCAPEMHLVSLDLFTTLLGSEIYGESIVKQCITADHVTALLKPYLLQNPQESTAAQAGQWVHVVTAALGLLVDLTDKITGVRESLSGLFESPAGFVQVPGLCQPVLNVQVPNGWRNSGAGRRRSVERSIDEITRKLEQSFEVSKDKQATSAQLKETRGQVKSLESHIRKLEATNDALEVKAKRLKVVLKSLEVLQQDNKSQSEMLTMLQRHSDSMKQKNDSEKNSLQDANSLLQRDKSNLEHELQALESQCQKNESALQAKTALVEKLRSQLDKHRQMQEMIRSISAPTYDTSDE